MSAKNHSWLLVVVAVSATVAFLGPQAWTVLFPHAQPVVSEALPQRESSQPVETPVVVAELPPVVIEPLPSVPVQKYQVDEAAGAAATLARYRQSCEFWSSRSGDAAGRIFRKRACKQMRDYAKSTGQRVPTVNIKTNPRASAKKPARKSSRVVPKECTQHDYGSVRYRQCRAQESQRLKKMCQFHQQREERSQAAQWCAAYEAYQIVK